MTRVSKQGQVDEIPTLASKTFSIEDTARGFNPLQQPIEVEPGPVNLDQEAFMRQPVEIHVHEAGSEDEPQFAEVTVNGDYRLIRRGEIVTVPRSHVAVLASAKQERMQQVKTVSPDGSMGYVEKMVPRLAYPFSVVNDPAGKRGADWTRKILSQPA